MTISSINSSIWSSQSTAQSQNRQNLPGSFGSALTSSSLLTTDTASGASDTAWDADASSSSSSSSTETLAQKFINYANETPFQRMEDAWMAQHHITQADYNAMSAADKQKLLDQMKQDIEARLKQQINNSSTASSTTSSTVSTTNILV